MRNRNKRKITAIALCVLLMLVFSPAIYSLSIYIQGSFTPTGVITPGNFTLIDTQEFGGEANTTEVIGDPVVVNLSVANGTTNVSLTTSNWSIEIQHEVPFNWSIETAPNVGSASDTLDTSGVKACPLSGLQSLTNYTVFVNITGSQLNLTFYFWTQESNFTWIVADFGGKANTTEPPGDPEVSDLSIPNGSTEVDLTTENWTIKITHELIFDWSIETVPNVGSASDTADSTGFKSCSLSGLQPLTNYTVYVNISGSVVNLTYWFITRDANYTWLSSGFGGRVTTLGNNPILSSESPSNNSIGNYLFPLLSITVQDYQSDNFNVTWSTNATEGWRFHNVSVTDGTFTQLATFANSSNTTYWWTVQVNDSAGYWTNATYKFETGYYDWGDWADWWKLIYAPESYRAPSDFTARRYDIQGINLTWTKNVNATHTYVEYTKVPVFGISVGDGTFVCNTTESAFNHSGLDPGTDYYYYGWSWNDTLGVFSDSNSTVNCTNPGSPSGFVSTGVTMNSIDLTWTKGTNTTYSVLVMNESSYPGYPTNPSNGTTKYNSTGSSYTVSSLDPGVTYYFSLWSYTSCGTLSPFYSSVNDTTTATADVPTNLTVTTENHSTISLTWTKGADTTVVVRKSGSYPSDHTDGTMIYNGTAQSYTDEGLTYVTHYYYRIWGWNGETMSDGFDEGENVTLPMPPVDLRGTIDGDTLTIQWTKGNGALTTVIRNSTTTYPTDPLGGDGSALTYNDTGEIKTVTGTSDIDYYTGWSYAFLDDYHLYSTGETILWGGLELNVFKQSNVTIPITNYDVFITNQEGTETYENMSQNNPVRIDVEDVPNGENIAIRVSKDGYNPSTIYSDLYENAWYSINFYLTPSVEGGGVPGEDDYIPPEDEPDGENESYGELYLFQVIDVYNVPIEVALVDVRMYINTTDQYESTYSVYTDANGNVQVFLIPEYFYKVTITKSGYDTEYADYIPSASVFTATFRLKFTSGDVVDTDALWRNITWSIEPQAYYHSSNITMYFNISSDNGRLEYYRMRVRRYFSNNRTWHTIYDVNESTLPYGGSLNFTTPNVSGRYDLTAWFKKQNFSEYRFSYGQGCRDYYITYEDIREAAEDIPENVYIIVTIVLAIAAIGLLLKMGAGELSGLAGIVVMVIMFFFRPDITIGDLSIWYIMITTGIVYAVLMFLRGRI
jgi:hypothetical protein